MNKIFVIMSTFILLSNAAFAYKETYSSNNDYRQNYYNGGEYCAPDSEDIYSGSKKNLFTKIKSAFAGQITGFTPQIPPSPYLNPYYGPSYNQGFYTGNQWNSHNSYYPQYPARLFGLSF